MLAANLNLLKPAKRTEPKVQDRFRLRFAHRKFFHQRGARLVGLANDADDLVDVEERDEVPGQHFEAGVDTPQTVACTPQQHLVAVIEKRLQSLAQGHHAGISAAVEDVDIYGDTHFEVGEAEQGFHEHLRLDRPALGFEDKAHLIGGFVGDVVKHRHFAPGEELGNSLDEPRFLDLVGNLHDDDLVLPVAGLFDEPPRAQP